MIKARGRMSNGKEVLILGLSFENLDRLRSDNGYIEIRGDEVGLPADIHIIAGETEAALTRLLAPSMDENTVIVPSEG